MPSKYIPKKDIAVELWVYGKKTLRHEVTEDQIVLKLAAFRELAVERKYGEWETYVVRKAQKRGGHNGYDKKLSREHAEKWKNKFKD